MNIKKIDGKVLQDAEADHIVGIIDDLILHSKRVKNKDEVDNEWTFPETKIMLSNARTDIDRMKILEVARRKTDLMFHRIRIKLIDHGIDGSSISASGFGYSEDAKYIDFSGKTSAFLKKSTKDKDDV